MRPITLEITGLNSFREGRVIQFEPLLRDNLFGIFGPTGSGKSTILDAMTLALFGEVKRAERKTHGIVNARSEECAVSFTFQITRDGRRECYRAERLFKRSDTGGAVTRRARLIRITDEEIPLADKEKDVTSMVEEILGIKAEDFRLSVVLPQGAFAEFLHLRPKDRGEMLQRIFGLEELGNRINTGLRDLRSRLEEERIGIEVKLESLQVYNDEALTQRRLELEQAQLKAEESRRQAAESERLLREGEELYRLILERDRLTEGEAKRSEEGTELQRLRAELQRAESAVVLEAIVRESERAYQRWEEALAEYEKAKSARQKGEELIGPLRERKEWAERERGPQGRLTELEKGIKGLEGIAEIDRRILLLLGSIQERREKIADAESRLAASLLHHREAVDAEQTGAADLKALEAKKQAVDEEEKQLMKRDVAVEKLERQAREREERTILLKKTEEEKKDLNDRIALLKESIAKALEERKACEALRDAERNRYEEARLGNVLGEALHLLHEGEPCPLCGAIDHPAPYAHPSSGDLKGVAAEVERAEQTLAAATDRLHTLEKEETSLRTQLFGIAVRREEIEGEIGRAEAEIAQTVAETGYKGEIDRTALREWRTKIAERLSRNEEEKEKVREERGSVEERLEDARRTIATTGTEKAKFEQEIESGKGELEREENELQQIRAERNERLREIDLQLVEGEGEEELTRQREEFDRLKEKIEEAEAHYEEGQEILNEASKEYDRCFTAREREGREKDRIGREMELKLKENAFNSVEEWRQAFIPLDERERKREVAEEIADRLKRAERRLAELNEAIGAGEMSAEELARLDAVQKEGVQARESALTALGKAQGGASECEAKNAEWKKIVAENERRGKEYAAMKKLSGYLQGNAFINFLADEYLQHICRTASLQLRDLTGGRLEIGSKGEEGFFILDNGNGGVERPPASLSGGETFLVSLALSLSLSDSLQAGRAPLEFFFLDEGFGTLDDELLEVVMDSLERLRAASHRAIGVISHVPHLRERIHRRLIVSPATDIAGSNVRLDIS